MKNAHSQTAEVSAQTKRKYSKSTTTNEAQLRKLAAFLLLRPHHTYELRKAGISHPAGRVNDLEERGYIIESSRITTVDSEGFPHYGVALYSLVSEPEQEVRND